MSDGLNKVFLMGNVGADPELRYTGSGVPVLTLRVATNESYVDRNRELQRRTDWHHVIVWGSRAEGLARFLTKGACVLVEGGLRTSTYEKDGSKRYKTEVIAKDVCVPSGRRSGSGAAEEDGAAPAGAAPAVAAAAVTYDAANGAGPISSVEPDSNESGEDSVRRPRAERIRKTSASPPPALASGDELPF
jgi:single-strand DNA-binding protein